MTLTAAVTEGDWAAPATKGDLKLLETDLEGKIEVEVAQLRVEMAKMDRSLRGEIAKLRVSMAWMTVGVASGLGGLITLFEFLS